MHGRVCAGRQAVEDLAGRFVALFLGAGGVAALVIVLWIAAPERAVIFLTQIASLFAGGSRMVRKRVVKGSVEGRLNLARRSLNKLTPEVLPYQAKIRWTDADNVESYLHEDNVIVRMSYHDNPHRNIVMAGLLYVRAGLLPEGRQYLRRPFQDALDLLAVDEMLTRVKEREALLYLRNDIVPKELKGDEALSEAHDLLGKLSDTGYLGRILLPELIDYPLRLRSVAPRATHLEESRRFIEYLYKLADAIYLEYFLPAPHGVAPLDFLDAHIRVSFVVVGRSEVLEARGPEAYLRRIQTCRVSGARTIYLLGAGRNAAQVRQIARTALKRGLIERYRLRDYNIPAEGRAVPFCFGRLVVQHGEAAEEAAAEQLARPTAPGTEVGG